MPIAAIAAAVARVAAATGSVAVRAGAATYRASAALASRAAAGARILGRATVKFASAVRRLIQRIGARIGRAARKALSVIRRGLVQFVQFAKNRIKAASEKVRSAYQNYKDKIDQRIMREISRAFNDAVAGSNNAFENVMSSPAQADRPRQIKLETLRSRFVDRFRQIVEDVSRQDSLTEADLVDIFRRRIAPELVAARIVMTEDPTSVLDEDAMYHLAIVAENFVAMAQNLESEMDNFRLSAYLTNEALMGARTAAFRQNLLSQVVRDRIAADTDNAIIASVTRFASPHARALSEEELAFIDVIVSEVLGSSVSSQPGRIVRLANSLSQVAPALSNRALQFIDDVISFVQKTYDATAGKYFRLLKARLAALTGNREDKAMLLDSEQDTVETPEDLEIQADELIQEAEDEQPDYEVGEEDEGIMYGVWETNAKRTVEKNCPDCEALETLTSMYPVPIYELPTPGAETLCAENCACEVHVVNKDEFDDVRSQWSSVWRRITDQEMPEQFTREDNEQVKALLKIMNKDARFFSKWAKRMSVDIGDL